MAYSLDLTDYKSADDLKGFDYPIPGQYHVVINKVDDSHDNVDGLKLEFIVLAGTGEHQIGKRWEEAFFWPSPDSKDGGKFARKKLGRLALATGLVTPAALGTQVEIDWSQLLYRQLKVGVESYERKKDGKTYKGAQIDGLSIYGPLDEDAAHVPVDAEAIQMAREAGQVNVLPPNPTPGNTPAARPKPAPAAAPPAKPTTTQRPAAPPAAGPAAPAPANKAPDSYANL